MPGQFKKRKKAVFICQITENTLKVAKYVLASREFTALEIGKPPDLKQIFQKLEYNHDPIIVSLPRSQATCRYLKIPSTDPQEIERMSILQAPRYLPYQANELVTGYEVVSSDKEGYSHINLVIAHRDLIARYLKTLEEFKPARVTIILSSYGLLSLYNYINPRDTAPVMAIDIDGNQAELVVISGTKLLFSRAFKINPGEPNWRDAFLEEINKSRDAYLKEVAQELPARVVIFGENKISAPAEALDYSRKISLPENFKAVTDAGNSFASLVGLGLSDIEGSLNLLPADLKAAARKISQRKENLRLAAYIAVILFIFSLGMARHLGNKAKYLEKFKTELNKISKEAEPLEELQKRFEFMQTRAQKKLSSLDILYEIHHNIPNQVSLISLNYEEDKQVILRGQTQELNSVFGFVSQLEKSSVFKNFNLKVRYATKRRTAVGEIIDFEIVCLKK